MKLIIRPEVPDEFLDRNIPAKISECFELLFKQHEYINYLEEQRDDWVSDMREIINMPQVKEARNRNGGGRNFFDIIKDVIKEI